MMSSAAVVARGGHFLCKVLHGGSEGDVLSNLKRESLTVKHIKPQASRADSQQLYVLAMGCRGEMLRRHLIYCFRSGVPPIAQYLTRQENAPIVFVGMYHDD